MDETKIKLNLKNVTELIGDTIEDWREGDFIIIETQTGTGKTHFVRMELIQWLSFDRILFLCNRINLMRQIKRDLLAMFNKEIPSNEELDKIERIGNTVVRSYQFEQERILNEDYYKTPYTRDYEFFDYIIFDECHYILSDSRFNNTTRLIFENYIQQTDLGATKIFMTATADEIKEPILEYVKRNKEKVKRIPYLSGGYRGEFEPKVYSSDIDYRYISAKYFKNIKDIVTTIQNDTSDDKWIVFVSNKEVGQEIKNALGKDSEFITAETNKVNPDNAELLSIVQNRKFNTKILIATSTLDNGISIEDESVKHIVIMAWDKITFIQMLGRRRVNIESADRINLYIPIRYKKSFISRSKIYDDKLEAIRLYRENLTSFQRKYDTDIKELGVNNELFYIDNETRRIMINPIGEWRIRADKEFAERMIEKFREDNKFAFVKEQLSWIGLEHTFDEANVIENVLPNREIDELENYLASLYEKKTVMLMRADRQELIEKINVRDGSNRILKNIKTLNSALEELGSQFIIQEFETSRNQKKYKNAWRIGRRV